MINRKGVQTGTQALGKYRTGGTRRGVQKCERICNVHRFVHRLSVTQSDTYQTHPDAAQLTVNFALAKYTKRTENLHFV